MSILTKIKMLLKFKKSANVAVQAVEEIKGVAMKSGWRSTEFAMSVLASLGAILASVAGALPPQFAVLVSSVSATAYTVSRGLAKQTVEGAGKKSGLVTTEFWVSLLSDLGAVLASVGGLLPPDQAVALVLLSRVAYSISRGLAKQND